MDGLNIPLGDGLGMQAIPSLIREADFITGPATGGKIWTFGPEEEDSQ